MKKLLLVPVVLMTSVLVFAFLMPATAASLLKSMAPVAHVNLSPVLSAVNPAGTAPRGDASSPAGGSTTAGTPDKQAAGPASSTGASSNLAQSNTAPLISVNDRGHAVATAGQVNCGRFGDGTHGGKHDMTCPNRSFPEPVN